MRVVPWLSICSSMEARAPLPRAIMAMTEATPMITPSMVRVERTLFRRMAFKATRRVSRKFMVYSVSSGGRARISWAASRLLSTA